MEAEKLKEENDRLRNTIMCLHNYIGIAHEAAHERLKDLGIKTEEPKTETGWLIEFNDVNMKGEPLLDYWAAMGATPDAMQAVRFARKEDGEQVLKFLETHGPLCSPQGRVTVTEHMFYIA